MDNRKKILLLIVASLMLFITPNKVANAKDQKCTKGYCATCITDGSSKDVSNYYGVTYEIGSGSGEFFIKAKNGVFKITNIQEGVYYQAGEKFIEGPLTHFGGNVADYINNPNALIKGSNTKTKLKAQNKLRITALSLVDTRDRTDGEFVLKISLALAESDVKCQTPEDYEQELLKKQENEEYSAGKFETEIYILLKDFREKYAPKQPNTDFHQPACQKIREVVNGINNESNKSLDSIVVSHISPAYYSEYNNLVPFCFNASDVVTNYGSQVNSLVVAAVQSTYAKHLPQSIVRDANFLEIAKQACESNLNGKYTTDSLGVSHCSKAGDNWQSIGENESPKVNNDLYCKYTWKDLGNKDIKGYQYTNSDAYYAIRKIVLTDNYKYKYDGEDEVADTQNQVCTKVCEEAVRVEYGPPQATIAGLCIEYQVKVQSYVECRTNLDAQPPKEGIVCVPTPNCVHKTFTSTQAGPTEEFDQCVNKCDGGEYTEACSNKCYDSVYKNKTKENLADNTNKSGIVKFMNKDALTNRGYYYREKNGNSYVIKWHSDSNNNNSKKYKYGNYNSGTYAQWYIDNEKERTENDDEENGGKYFADGGGFKRQRSGSTICNGDCAYQNCGDDTYLTQERMSQDFSENMRKYNDIVEACAAQATCTNSTATFTIKAEINEGWKTFPLNGGKDSLESKEIGLNKNKKINKGSALLDYDGCYNDSGAKSWYMAEWSFPGTWTNNKTGEISYEEKPSNTWNLTSKRFCLPLNTKNVNVKWWNYYQNMQLKYGQLIKGNKGSYLSEEYKKSHTAVISQTSVPKIDKWNIEALTEKFGYFGWNFKIHCFYASYQDSLVETPQKPPVQNNPIDYSPRTVSNNNLFPSADPEDTTGLIDKTKTGRIQGFNWTEAATISDSKNPYYAVNPELLITKIQSIGNKIYDESKESEYLDYSFTLTPDTLRKIRDNTKKKLGNDYLNYDESGIKYYEDKKIYVYQSSLIRNVLVYNKEVNKLPSVQELGCNNISKGKCEINFTKIGGQQ